MEKNQIFALIINFILLAFIINSIRRGGLKEKYALLWIFSSLTFMLFSVWFEPIKFFSRLFGIASPVNLLFLMGGVYMLLIILHISHALSTSHDNYKKLAQRIALLEERLKQKVLDDKEKNL